MKDYPETFYPEAYAVVAASNGQEAYGRACDRDIDQAKRSAMLRLKAFVHDQGLTADWSKVRYACQN